MTAPNFLGLPVFPHFYFVLELTCRLFLEVLLCRRHSISLAVGVVEDILASANELVAFVLPEYGSAIVTSTGEESADGIPAHTINRLLMVAEFGQFAHRFHLLLVKEGFHHVDIRLVRR